MTRAWLTVAGAVAAIGLLLTLPPPGRPATAVPLAGRQSAPTGPTLASVWPHAKPFPIPAGFPDGSPYTPTVILDATTSVGTVARADGLHTDLAEVPAGGPPRILQTQLVTDGGSFDGITATTDRLYWMHSISTSDGTVDVSLWNADRAGGPPRQLSRDVGKPEFYGSSYDVQAVGDRLYWTAGRPGRQDQTELRSIPLTGGPVTVKVLDGAWALSTWPWLVTAPHASDQPTRLMNAVSGQVVPVNAPPNKLITCTPTWCRMVPDNSAGPAETDLIRPDGADLRKIADDSTAAIGAEVAQLDRFELLMTVIDPTAQLIVSKLTVYDITHQRTVLISPAATNASSRGDFLWWSTGDNETLTWHGLDLRSLA